jgi:cell division protein FtsB
MFERTTQNSIFKKISTRWLIWWRSQSPRRQDRYALFAPLTAVILFLAAIFAAFTFLRYEEMQREQEGVRSDVEYTQQRIRLRVLERQEQSMQLANELYKGDIGPEELASLSNNVIKNFPEITSMAWISTDLKVKISSTSLNIDGYLQLKAGDKLKNSISVSTFNLA